MFEALEDKTNYSPVKDMELDSSDIYSISIQSGCWEIGKQGKRLHMHVKVTLLYNGRSHGYFHIDRAKIENQIRLSVPGINWGKAPYVNVRFIKSTPENSLTSYINKEIHNNPNFSLVQRNYEYEKEKRRGRFQFQDSSSG